MEEWQARVCDLLYLASCRPGDLLELRDDMNIARRDDGTTELRFTIHKTGQPFEIEDATGDIERTVEWLRAWKKEQGLLVPHLICYPTSTKRRHVGKPLSVDYLSRVFMDAAVAAGMPKGRYTLRDIRPMALTEEARIVGVATDKGGHETEAMKQRYVRVMLPIRARNNVTAPKRASG